MADIHELKYKAVNLLNKSEEMHLTLNDSAHFLVFKENAPTELNATIYEPVLCLILQGEKEIIVGERRFTFRAGQMLIVSHDMPVVSKITEASDAKPYVALVLRLNIKMLMDLEYEFPEIPLDLVQAKSLEVNDATSLVIDSLFRLMDASQDTTDTLVLLPQILREVHFRVLQAPCSGMLRNLIRHNSHASKISKAISLIRDKYSKSLSVADVARSVGMSVSSFHHHFKVITESTPLQYQKNIRLLEAKRLLISEGESVTLTALKVGYESPNQFSREYLRKFGSPPSNDLKARILTL